MLRLEHLGIAVKELENAIPLYERLLDTVCYKTEAVASESVSTAFFKVGDTKIELLESTAENSVIAKFVESRGEGLHHVAFDVADIYAEIHRLQAAGFQVINPIPKIGADNKLVCFLHPRTTNGVLVELCQEIT